MDFAGSTFQFAATFPKPVTNGSTVTLVGKFKPGSLRFDLNLVCMPSGDRALHCSFRLNDQVVVRNHNAHHPIGDASHWGQAVEDGGWPIKKSGEFEISMKIKEDNIKIFIDGRFFADFPHRLPYSKITHINGSVGADFTTIKFEKKID